ncbi:MAG: hypothetical protein ACLFRR_03195 [Spirochaetaceae bacterium]
MIGVNRSADGTQSCCERVREDSALAAVVEQTEPFFRNVMEVYIDLLCRGEREASRVLFASLVRFTGAVCGMKRCAASGRSAALSTAAAKRHLMRCLFALWTLKQRGTLEPQELFEQGLRLLRDLRAQQDTALAPSWCATGKENTQWMNATTSSPPSR